MPDQPTEHFIPVRLSELVERLVAHPGLAARRAHAARLFAGLADLFHVEFHRRAARLKERYAPLDPNADTVALAPAPASTSAERQAAIHQGFGQEFTALLERANYRQLTAADLDYAFKAESVFHVKLHTEMSDFAELSLWRRGLRRRQEVVRAWFGLRRRLIEVEYCERVALHVRFQEAEHFPAKRRALLPFKPGSTVLKLFENIPLADLEMLFPNSEVRMKIKDQLMLGVPAVLGSLTIIGKLGFTLLFVMGLALSVVGLSDEPAKVEHAQLVALGAAIFTLGIFVSKQLGRFRFRKMQFLKVLADSLYYRNLDNNAGVIHRLIDSAEEEEVKEVILGWTFLELGGAATAAELDARIEAWFRDDLKVPIDFEVDDALAKLERLGLAQRDGERWRVAGVEATQAIVAERWRTALTDGHAG